MPRNALWATHQGIRSFVPNTRLNPIDSRVKNNTIIEDSINSTNTVFTVYVEKEMLPNRCSSLVHLSNPSYCRNTSNSNFTTCRGRSDANVIYSRSSALYGIRDPLRSSLLLHWAMHADESLNFSSQYLAQSCRMHFDVGFGCFLRPPQ
jgi:hypothetical protein